MNLVKTCPDIPDDWKGGMSDTCKLLGISWKTLDKYAKLDNRRGGIRWKPRNGRRLFSGREIKRFWNDF